MKKRIKIIIAVLLIVAMITTGIIFFATRTKIVTYSNGNFRVSYDTTWKVKNDKDELYLIHKKTNSELRIQCKILEANYIGTKLSDIVDDVRYSIEQQNEGYKLINSESNISDKYDGYSYLYEKEDKQVLVNIYKKDAKLIIAYYEADSKYYDIVLDSVDIIFSSLEFVFV